MARPTQILVAEPPAEYRVRPPLVVDASVLAACIFGEPERDAAEARLKGFALHAPELIDYELTNVATTKLRRKDLAPEIAAQALAEFAAMALLRHSPAPQDIAALAWRYGLTAYDAAYLWVAGELKAPLATFDRRLAEAATLHLGSLPTA